MKPVMICFMGLDGSGKSTSIEHACRVLRERGCRAEIVRAAYVLEYMNGLVKLGKKLLMKKDSDPFSGDYRAYLASLRRHGQKGLVYRVFSFLTTIEFRLQIFFRITCKRLMGRTLLVDRYIYDNVVTYAANLGLGADYMERTLVGKWRHAPRPDRVIYIRTPVDVCLSRKDDVPDPLYLQLREPLYEQLAESCGAVVIPGDQPLEAMLEQVMAAVDECTLPDAKGSE